MSSESGPVTSTLTGRLRDDADFRRYWAARIASLSGSIVTAVAMPVLIYRLTASPGLTALTTTLEALPYLVVGLLAGALADRLDRKRVMVVADLLNVLVVGSVPLAWWLGVLTVPHVLVAAFCAQLLFTFFDGANFGALPVLVGRARVGEANAAIWGFGGVLDLLMPAAAGALLAVLHPADLLAVDALSYAVSAMLVRSIGRALSVTRGPGPPLRPRGCGRMSSMARVSSGGMRGCGPTPSSARCSPSPEPGSWRWSSHGPTGCCTSAPRGGGSACSTASGASAASPPQR